MPETNPGGNTEDAQPLLEFEIEIIDPEATEEDLDRTTRNLLAELRQTDIDSAELVSIGSAPEGSKGDPVTIGSLAMTVLPTVLPGVIDMIKDWSGRKASRTVKFKGKGIEFEGSAEDLEKLLATLNEGKKKK